MSAPRVCTKNICLTSRKKWKLEGSATPCGASFSSFLPSLLEGAGQLEFVVCRQETEILLTAKLGIAARAEQSPLSKGLGRISHSQQLHVFCSNCSVLGNLKNNQTLFRGGLFFVSDLSLSVTLA